MNTASAEILAAVIGTSLESARKGLEDAPFQSLEEAVAILGIAGSDTSLLTLSGTTQHVENIGRAGDARCGIALVLDLKVACLE